MRLFVAIEIPSGVKLLLEKLVSALKNDYQINGKWVEAENWHITLAFLGEVSPEKLPAINNSLATIGTLQNESTLVIDKMVGIPKGQPRILALTTRSGFIFNLQKKVQAALKQINVMADVKPSHLTLIRLKQVLPVSPQFNFRPLNFKVNQFVLFESKLTQKVPVYYPIKTFKLFSSGTVSLLRPNLAICVINPQDEILLIRRAGSNVRAWQFPQGGIIAGDSLEQTLIKEINEEVGITKFETILLKKQVYKYLWPKSLREKGKDLEKKPYFGQEQSLAIIRVSEDKPQLKLDPHEAADAKWVHCSRLIESLQPARRKFGKLVLLELQRLILPSYSRK